MKLFKLLWLLVFGSGIVLILVDRQLFNYGKSQFAFYDHLPLSVRPEARPEFEGGFVIRDKHGLSLVGKGVRYRNSEVIFDEIIGYGFTSEKLITQVTDKKGRDYYIEFTPNVSSRSGSDILVNIRTEAEKPRLENFNWISIKGNDGVVRTLVYLRFALLIILFLSILIVIRRKIKS